MLAAYWPRGRWIVAALALAASQAWLKDELSLCHRLYWSYSRASRCGEHERCVVCGVGAHTDVNPHQHTLVPRELARTRAAKHTSKQTRVPFPFPRSPVRGTSRHQLMPRFYAPRKQFDIEGAVQECSAVPVLEDLSLKGTAGVASPTNAIFV